MTTTLSLPFILWAIMHFSDSAGNVAVFYLIHCVNEILDK